MGVYANEPALRAMAGLAHQNLVVITSNSGSNIEKPEFRHKPFDKVMVYFCTCLAFQERERQLWLNLSHGHVMWCLLYSTPSEHLNIGSSFTKETSARVNQWAL